MCIRDRLEDVNLLGARGVLVNITASAGLRMKEYHEVMNTIKEFTAEDAMVIVGTVIDESMEDRLRVTMVATGLGGAAAARQRTPNIQLVEVVVVDRVGRHRDAIRAIAHDGRTGAVVRRGRDPGLPAQAGGLTMRRPAAGLGKPAAAGALW